MSYTIFLFSFFRSAKSENIFSLIVEGKHFLRKIPKKSFLTWRCEFLPIYVLLIIKINSEFFYFFFKNFYFKEIIHWHSQDQNGLSYSSEGQAADWPVEIGTQRPELALEANQWARPFALRLHQWKEKIGL